MTQPAPGYRPYQPPPPMPAAPRRRRGVTSILTGMLALVAAGVAVGGSFGNISTFRNELPSGGEVYTEQHTWWYVGHDETSIDAPDTGFISGLVLALAAALLIAAAIAMFVRPRGVAGRSLTVAGVGVLTGCVLLQLLNVIDAMGVYNARTLNAGETLEYHAGIGLYLPLGALVVGIVAAVLAHLGGQGADGARVEPNTPRMGFPAPYGYQPGMAGAPFPGAPAPNAAPASAATPSADSAADPGAAGAAAGGQAEVPLSERATDLNVPTPTPPATPDDDADTTQVVSDATGGAAPAPTGEPAVPPPAPVPPPATAPPGAAEPTPAPTTPANEPPANATPANATPANATPANATPANATPANATPTNETPANPLPANESPAEDPSPAAAPGEASDKPAEPTPVTDLPAAPPPPELSSSENDKK